MLYLAFEYNRGGNIAHQLSEYFRVITFCKKYNYKFAYIPFKNNSSYFNKIYDFSIFHEYQYNILQLDNNIINIDCNNLLDNFINKCKYYETQKDKTCIFCPLTEYPNIISIITSKITQDEITNTIKLYKGLLYNNIPNYANCEYICIHNIDSSTNGIKTDSNYYLEKYSELINMHNVSKTMPVYIFDNNFDIDIYKNVITNLVIKNLSDENVIKTVAHAKFFIASKTGISNIAHIFSNCMTIIVKDDWNVYFDNKIYNNLIKDEYDNIIDTDRIETTEQDLAKKYIQENDVILELGARYGSVSCVVNKKLKNKKNHIVVEPDNRVWCALEKNRNFNNCEFHIVKGFISKKKLSLTNLDNCRGGYGSTAYEDKLSVINSYSLEEIQNLYNIIPNVLIADCEGFLENFFDENPNLYTSLNKILFESDYPDKCDYDKIKTNLLNNGFINAETVGNQHVWIK
jgi:FkbM family methyltransferase